MKLAIVVVYLAGEQDRDLLGLHLAKIREHTTCPYRIYASVSRLPAQLVDLLRGNPEVVICDCDGTELRGGEEHSHYLEQLVHRAAADEAEYICCMHLDSFPIVDGWQDSLIGQLDEENLFATMSIGKFRAYTACLLFPTTFYQQFQPRFRISPEQVGCPLHTRFCKEVDHVDHSGCGYLFRAFELGKSWIPLAETAPLDGTSLFGTVHGDLIFHLRGAARVSQEWGGNSGCVRGALAGPLNVTRRIAKGMIPNRLQPAIASTLKPFLGRVFFTPAFEQARALLIKDPEQFVVELQKRGRERESSGQQL